MSERERDRQTDRQRWREAGRLRQTEKERDGHGARDCDEFKN